MKVSPNKSISNIPFETIDWESIPTVEYKGEKGIAYWKTIQYNNIRIRIVQYSPDYIADHWCKKGHIIYCMEGELTTEFSDGNSCILRKGMSYHVSDNLSTHRSVTKVGAKLFIVDGDFLK